MFRILALMFLAIFSEVLFAEAKNDGYSDMKSKENNVISIRPLTSGDLEAFLAWATDDKVTKTLMWENYKSDVEARKFLENVVDDHPCFMAICYNGKVVGSITLEGSNNVSFGCKVEMGYVVAKNFWGKGIATRAVQLIVEKAFEDPSIFRVEAFVDPDNVASIRVLEKSHFRREGLLKSCILQKGKLRDRIVFAITRAR